MEERYKKIDELYKILNINNDNVIPNNKLNTGALWQKLNSNWQSVTTNNKSLVQHCINIEVISA